LDSKTTEIHPPPRRGEEEEKLRLKGLSCDKRKKRMNEKREDIHSFYWLASFLIHLLFQKAQNGSMTKQGVKSNHEKIC